MIKLISLGQAIYSNDKFLISIEIVHNCEIVSKFDNMRINIEPIRYQEHFCEIYDNLLCGRNPIFEYFINLEFGYSLCIRLQ